MAASITQANSLAEEARTLARRMRALKRDVDDFVTNNTKQGINWGSPPQYLTDALDASGNITGYPFSPAQVSNFLGTAVQFQNLLNNQTVTEGDHAANVYSIASDGAV